MFFSSFHFAFRPPSRLHFFCFFLKALKKTRQSRPAKVKYVLDGSYVKLLTCFNTSISKCNAIFYYAGFFGYQNRNHLGKLKERCINNFKFSLGYDYIDKVCNQSTTKRPTLFSHLQSWKARLVNHGRKGIMLPPSKKTNSERQPE